MTALADKLANSTNPRLALALIQWFIKNYEVDMSEAANPAIETYASYNDFFTRSLRPGLRPIAHADYVCPVDGAISQLGKIFNDQIIQAKNHHYSTSALLGGDQALATSFDNGQFVTLYLSPKDYHRVHMPCDGRLKKMTFVPGRLFSVNPTTANGVPGLFARNERVVCTFESEHGSFAMVLVGATIVGSIATVWHGIVRGESRRKGKSWDYGHEGVTLKQGEEMGRFLLGSTVILLFPKNTVRFQADWTPSRQVRLGEAMGTRP